MLNWCRYKDIYDLEKKSLRTQSSVMTASLPLPGYHEIRQLASAMSSSKTFCFATILKVIAPTNHGLKDMEAWPKITIIP